MKSCLNCWTLFAVTFLKSQSTSVNTVIEYPLTPRKISKRCYFSISPRKLLFFSNFPRIPRGFLFFYFNFVLKSPVNSKYCAALRSSIFIFSENLCGHVDGGSGGGVILSPWYQNITIVFFQKAKNKIFCVLLMTFLIINSTNNCQ